MVMMTIVVMIVKTVVKMITMTIYRWLTISMANVTGPEATMLTISMMTTTIIPRKRGS